MKRTGNVLIDFVATAAVILILAAILYPVFDRVRYNYQKSQQIEKQK